MARLTVGNCEKCGKILRVKQGALKPLMHLTCNCGWHGPIYSNALTTTRRWTGFSILWVTVVICSSFGLLYLFARLYSTVDYSSLFFECDPFWVFRWIINVPVALVASIILCAASACEIQYCLKPKTLDIERFMRLPTTIAIVTLFLSSCYVLWCLLGSGFFRVAVCGLTLLGWIALFRDTTATDSKRIRLKNLIPYVVLLILVQCLLIRLNYFAARSTFLPFIPELATLMTTKHADGKSTVTQTARLVLLMTSQNGKTDLSPLHIKLPANMRASSPSDATVVGFVSDDYNVIAHYGPRTIKENDKRIVLIDRESGKSVGIVRVEGQRLAKLPFSSSGQTLSPPSDQDVVNAVVAQSIASKEPNKTVDSTATRVTPPAEQEPRHGQP